MIFFLDINIEEEGEKIHVNKLPSLNLEKICEGVVHVCRPNQVAVADSEQSTKQMKRNCSIHKKKLS